MSSKQPPIAIVGLGALFPGSTDANGLWRDIAAGKDQLTEIPKAHWLIEDYYDPDPKAPDKTYAKRGGFIPEVAFDPMEHGMPPSVIPATDTSQLLGLIVAKQLLADISQGPFPDALRERTSVIVGITSAQELLVEMGSRLQRPIWVRALREHGLPEDEVQKVCDRIAGSYSPWQESTFPGLLGNVVAGRIANRLNLGGTNCVVDAACASAFGALAMGVQELYLGSSDLVITGGVETFNDIFMYMCFSKTPALSFSGDCRPFDAKSDGTMLGEGIGLLGLRRLEDAERDGNPIYAVIKAVGSSSDGRAKSIYAPVSAGQAKALRRAYEASGFGPDTIELVEAHGTGTKAGDAAEFGGLQSVFGESPRKDTQWCALGSIKSQIGHTKAAAGAAGLMKATLALHNKVLPPTIKIETPNPALTIEETAFYLNSEAKPWIRDHTHPRRAAVSSFGFGGSNFHITLEEYTGKGKTAARMRTLTSELVALSAKDPGALVAAIDAVLADLRAGASLSGAALDAAGRFDAAADCRLAVVANSTADLEKQLGLARPKVDGPAFSLPGGPVYGRGPKAPGSIAFLFPGQGSQAVGMGRELAMAFDVARQTWDDHADLHFGNDGERSTIHRMVFPPSAYTDEARAAQTARLTATEWAQPALGLASLATLRLLRHLGVDGDVFGGHSFGEVTALHAGGAIDAASMLQTARKRGELMRDAATTSGAMWAISLGKQSVEALEALLKAPVVIANRNSKKQVVIAGPTEAVDAAAAELKAQGFKGTRLPVATAFHSSVVAGSVDPFASFLKSQPITVPQKPVYANSTAQRYAGGEDGIRATLASQIASSVRFSEEIETMYADGVRTFVEVGPGAVLTGLVKDTLGDAPHLAIATDRKGSSGAASFLQAVGALAANGVAVDLAKLFEGTRVEARKEAPKPHAIMISGANYGKPYPPKEGSAALPKPNPPRKPTASEPAPVNAPAPMAAAGPMTFAEEEATVKPTPNLQDPEWLRAFAEVQRQTAEAHSAYQRSMAESHMAFLRTSEAAIASISGQALPAPMPHAATSYAAPMSPAVPLPAPAPMPVPVAATVIAPVVQAMPAAAPVAPVAPTPAPVSAPVAAPAAGPSISEALLAVVADKTGYPKDMIGLDMEIESDLGIDSIKRVEILSAVQEQVPSLPAIPAAELGAMRTLRNILDRFGASVDVSAPADLPAAVPAVSAPAAAASAPGGESITSALLAVVADKTGYPKDMIGLDMEIESDLGIDSIKRVEILSAVQERVPSLPSIPAAELGAMRTLRNILDRFGAVTDVSAATSSVNAAPAIVAAAAAPAAGSASIREVLLGVVADKTGYPKDMIGLDMEIESDLGIDSIKRVEILSAVQEQVPTLPTIPAAELGAIRTLGQILERLGGAAETPVAPAPAPTAVVTEAPSPAQKSVSAPTKLGRFVAVRRGAPRPGFSPRGLFSGAVTIVRGASGLADPLASLLLSRGVEAVVVDAFDPKSAARVIDLSGLADERSVEEAIETQKKIFATARAVAQSPETPRFFIAVADPFFGSTNAEWTGGIPGLVRTLALEAPEITSRFIAIAKGRVDADRLAQTVAAEILEGGADLDIAIDSSGNRTAPFFEDAPAITDAEGVKPRLEDGSVLLVSGGARGVTASCLEELAKAGKYKFAILGRTDSDFAPAWAEGKKTEGELQSAFIAAEKALGHTPTPGEARSAAQHVNAARETRATLEALRAAGSEVLYFPCDLKDKGDVSMAVSMVRAHFKRIDGVIQAAGVLADKKIAEKTDAQFNSVFDTKVAGLHNLLEATRPDDLRLLCFFGSVAGRVGNPGQADYAMANETLESVAQFESRQRRNAIVRVLHWGPWDGGMVTPSLRAVFLERGVALIPVADGARMFVDAITHPQAPVSVVVGGRPDASVLLGHGGGRKLVGDLVISSATAPHLASHAVKGVPVFPVALALEAFARIARSTRPDLRLSAIKDLKVLKGIRIENFEGKGTRLEISCEQVSNGSGARLACELRSPGGPVHYRAMAAMADRSLPHASPQEFEAPKTGTPWATEEVYGPVLFHGPDFQVLKGVRSVGPQGGSALVASTRDIGWIGGPYATDPAAVDAGLQMAILMGMRAIGKTSLPTGVESLTIHIDEPTSGPLHCSIRSRSVSDLKTVSDAIVRTEDGRLLCELRGIEMHMVDTAKKA
ncbi:MAG: SDR family NAD(P)-dependent oxidoreductase [Vicinamibacteria bacterium]|nr:SDR family NAD(P)-dependent oxidoreductase [Vicinamibacteria bacterium]